MYESYILTRYSICFVQANYAAIVPDAHWEGLYLSTVVAEKTLSPFSLHNEVDSKQVSMTSCCMNVQYSTVYCSV